MPARPPGRLGWWAWLLGLAVRAHGAAIPGLFGTGVDSAGGLLPGGSVDPHWVLIQSADAAAPGPAAYVVQEGYPIPPWLANGPGSKWIAPGANQGGGNQAGNYVYRLTFDLTQFDAATAVITARWSSDNAGPEVRLNGRSTGNSYDGNFGAFSSYFTLTNGFVDGLNTLDFVVNNAGDSVNPTGFRAELQGTAQSVAPPGTPPTITRQPASLTVGYKEPAVFSVGVYGSRPLFYQWRLHGRPIENATNASLALPYVTLLDAGPYDVIARNAFGSATSQVATLALRFLSPAQENYEPTGPSSRRTGIAITELMYHPAPRADGRELEFIELYNSNPFFEDLSGWRLSGEIDFVFPARTLLAGGSYLVVAATPADVRAVYGITNVIGGFTNRLANAGGVLRLRKRSQAIVLEVPYSDRAPWPAASDGTGHSLVLARPSYGERDPRAWAPSAWRGGSPGGPDPIPEGPLTGIVINELLGHSGPGADFIELHNHSPRPVDLGGCVLSDDPLAARYRIPEGTVIEARGFAVFHEPQLGFAVDAAGEAVVLLDPAQTRVLDAVRFSPQPLGTALGRFPDGDAALRPLPAPTPGAANARPETPSVVINEIMYHPLSGLEDDQYVELFNRGTGALDLAGWRLGGGVRYQVPEGVSIRPGEFLVIARNAVRLRTNDATLDPTRLLGDFSGALAGSGERLSLERPVTLVRVDPAHPEPVTNVVFAVVDEVTYGDGGRWGDWADGGGSSLERVDPRADPNFAPAWADSDESAKAPWTLVEKTGVLTSPHPSLTSAEQLQLFLLGPGEALVDNVEVLVGGNNRIANSTFESGVNGWTFQGTQRRSFWDQGGGYNSPRSLHLVATERGDHVANRVFAPLKSTIGSGTSATIRARVRWLKGHPEILFRFRNGALEAFARLTVPPALGTPGKPNSRARANLGPAIAAVLHHPPLPPAGQPIRITARVDDPDGVASVLGRFRLDPATSTTAFALVDDGSGPDEIAGDGRFTGIIPAQSGGALVAYQLEATDAAPAPAVSRFPADAPARECLVRVGDSHVPGALGNYHLWLTSAAHAFWANREQMSNEDVDATFVSGTNRVIYNAGAHYSGSSYSSPGYNSPTGNLCGYDVNFPSDDRFLGERHVTLDWPIRDDTDQREQLMFWFLERFGLPNMYRRYVHLFVNGIRRGTIYDDVQQPGGETIDEWYPDDNQGALYKTDCWNEFDNGGNRLDPCLLNTLENFTLAGGQKNTSRYRWNWRPRAVRGSANDFAPLFALVDAVNSTNDYLARVEAVVDVDHWMRTFAMNDLASFWDAFGNPNAKNTFLYKPEQAGWKLLCWDFDVGLGVFGDPPDAALFDVGDPTIRRMYQTSAWVRLYWAALDEAMTSFFQAGAIDPMLDAKYAGLRANGVAVNGPAGIKSWITQRRAYLQSQLNTVRAAFAITSNNGNDYTSAAPVVMLSGTAPVAVRTITVNDIPYPVTWSSVTRWNLNLALDPGTNTLAVAGLDRTGAPVPAATDSIRVQYTGTNTPLPTLVINEWMAANASAVADPADGAFDDWFELYNPGALPVPIAGFWLSDDPDRPAKAVVPKGFFVPPHGHLLVWADEQPDQARPDAHLHVDFRLAQGGEQILLSDASGRLIDAVAFGPQAPDHSEGRWPDGLPAPFYPMAPATPNGPNQVDAGDRPEIRIRDVRVEPDGGVTLTWDALPGRTYRARFLEDLGAAAWIDLSPDIVAVGDTASLLDTSAAPDGQRYYQVILLVPQ